MRAEALGCSSTALTHRSRPREGGTQPGVRRCVMFAAVGPRSSVFGRL